MKKVLLTMIACAAMVQSTFAQSPAVQDEDFYAPGKRIGLALGVGVMDGISLEGSVSLTKWCVGRVGVDFMPGISYTFNDSFGLTANGYSIQDVNEKLHQAGYDLTIPSKVDASIKGSLDRTQAHMLFDFYPAPASSSFFITAGAYFGGKKVIDLDGNVSNWSTIKAAEQVLKPLGIDLGVNIADYNVPIEDNGAILAGLRVNSFRPYVGFGFGRAIPKNRVACRFEMGVQLHGKAKVYSSNSDDLLSESFGKFDNTKDEIKDIVEKVVVLPVIKFSVRTRIL